jgi:ppGpp synthetase/RelA/SpoT-type nucleotidyltranferase
MDRNEQDGMVERLVGLFQSTEVVDRRTNPSFGYRAVHVIAHEHGYPVEIQVRTGLQNAWAQVFERLADALGRQIRYGEPPDEPDKEFVEGVTGQTVVDFFMALSGRIDQVEAATVMAKETERKLEEQRRQLEETKKELKEATERHRSAGA